MVEKVERDMSQVRKDALVKVNHSLELNVTDATIIASAANRTDYGLRVDDAASTKLMDGIRVNSTGAANISANATESMKTLQSATVATSAKATATSKADSTKSTQSGKGAQGAKHKLTPRSWCAITFSFAFVVKALCMLSNVCFQVSPIPQVRLFSKQQDTGEADAAPFISILYGGCQWCFYGLFAFLVTKKSGFLVLVYSNVAGAFLGIYYVYGFQQNCRNSKSRRQLFTYYKIVSSLALLQALAMAIFQRQQALFFSGLVSSVCSVVGACSLIVTLPKVLETRCSASINVPLLSVGMISGCLWLCCGFILWDAWIAVPNLICLFIQLATACVVLYFPREPPAGPSTQLDSELSRPNQAPRASGAPAPRSAYGTFRVMGETGGTF